VPGRKAVISLEFLFGQVRDLSRLTQPMIFGTRQIRSESHFIKADQKNAGAALYKANPVPAALTCSFQDVVVNNEAVLWIISLRGAPIP
jgi:hypothetical protein